MCETHPADYVVLDPGSPLESPLKLASVALALGGPALASRGKSKAEHAKHA